MLLSVSFDAMLIFFLHHTIITLKEWATFYYKWYFTIENRARIHLRNNHSVSCLSFRELDASIDHIEAQYNSTGEVIRDTVSIYSAKQ